MTIAWVAMTLSFNLVGCNTKEYSQERLARACEEIKQSGVDPLLRDKEVGSCGKLCDDYQVAGACEREGESLGRGGLFLGNPAAVAKGRQYVLKACAARSQAEASCESLQNFDRKYGQLLR